MNMKTARFLIAVILGIPSSLVVAAQSIQSIQTAIEQFATARLEQEARYDIAVAPLDPRLQLPDCADALQIFLPGDELKPGRNTVGARCTAPQPWTIYSTVNIKMYKDIVVLTKPLRRNDLIKAEHVKVETRDTATLQQGYVQSIDDVIDKQATRHLAPGTVLSRALFIEPPVIKRGTRVNIQSGRKGLLISAPGIAMMDGGKGQQISVKNASSQRMIRATVVDPQTVLVAF